MRHHEDQTKIYSLWFFFFRPDSINAENVLTDVLLTSYVFIVFKCFFFILEHLRVSHARGNFQSHLNSGHRAKHSVA